MSTKATRKPPHPRNAGPPRHPDHEIVGQGHQSPSPSTSMYLLSDLARSNIKRHYTCNMVHVAIVEQDASPIYVVLLHHLDHSSQGVHLLDHHIELVNAYPCGKQRWWY